MHRAALRDGRPVVVKVQRPEIRKQIADDFEVLEEIADLFDEHTEVGRRYRFGKILAEFKSSILQELDYLREASNQTTLANNLKEFPHLLVPQPVLDYSSLEVVAVPSVRLPALSRKTVRSPSMLAVPVLRQDPDRCHWGWLGCDETTIAIDSRIEGEEDASHSPST